MVNVVVNVLVIVIGDVNVMYVVVLETSVVVDVTVVVWVMYLVVVKAIVVTTVLVIKYVLVIVVTNVASKALPVETSCELANASSSTMMVKVIITRVRNEDTLLTS